MEGRESFLCQPELLWVSGPALPRGWAEPCAFLFQIHSFWRSWSQNCKTTRAQGIRSCEWLHCMFDLTENIKQLALCSPLCNVYKMIITTKKRQQELTQVKQITLKVALWHNGVRTHFLSHWNNPIISCWQTEGRKAVLNPWENGTIYRDMSKAGELTQLLRGKLGFLREELLKAGGWTEKKPRGLSHGSINPGKDNPIFITPTVPN